MKIIIEKPEIPIIWLDTFVIIWLKKLKYGEIIDNKDPTNDKDIKIKLDKLYNIIYQKVRENKLICPKGEQDSEIELKLGPDNLRKCFNIQTKLSLGIEFFPWSQIRSTQMKQVMKAYIEGEKCVDMSYKDVFLRDPINELKNRENSFVIVNIIPHKELISKRRDSKKLTNEQLEEVRQKNVSAGITYEKQLNIEYQSVIELIWTELPKLMSNIYSRIAQPEDFDKFMTIWDKFMAIWEPYILWKNCHKGQGKNKFKLLNGLLKFLFSEDYKSIPFEEISCKLMADIITRRSPIKSGDYMDIDHLSAVIPYCKFVITDRKMKATVNRRKIDTKYKTKVYCYRDFDVLINELGKL